MKSIILAILLLLFPSLSFAEAVGMKITIFSEEKGIPSYDVSSDIKDWNLKHLTTDQMCDLLKNAKNPYGWAVVLLIQSQRNVNDEYTKSLFNAINANNRLILSYYNTTHPFRVGFPTRDKAEQDAAANP